MSTDQAANAALIEKLARHLCRLTAHGSIDDHVWKVCADGYRSEAEAILVDLGINAPGAPPLPTVESGDTAPVVSLVSAAEGGSPQPAPSESGRLDVTAAELADLLTEARASIERMHLAALRAVAHDRQPYPTADAYEKACAALHHHRRRADALARHAGEEYPNGFRDAATVLERAKATYMGPVRSAVDAFAGAVLAGLRDREAALRLRLADEELTDRSRHGDESNPPDEPMLWYAAHTHPGLRYSHQHFPAYETPGHDHADTALVPWARRDAPQETEATR